MFTRLFIVALYGLLLLILLPGLVSCKQIVLWKYGIHNPRTESRASIGKFLNKTEVQNENIFVCRDSAAFYTCLRDTVFRENLFSTMVFSSTGLLNRLRDSSSCQWAGGMWISRLRPDTLYDTDTAYSFKKLMERFVPLNPSTRVDTAGASFLAVVSWGTFLGSYNKRLFSVQESAIQQSNVRVKTLFLCMDMLEEWNLTREQMRGYSIK